jgi:hypothetical protein
MQQETLTVCHTDLGTVATPVPLAPRPLAEVAVPIRSAGLRPISYHSLNTMLGLQRSLSRESEVAGAIKEDRGSSLPALAPQILSVRECGEGDGQRLA